MRDRLRATVVSAVTLAVIFTAFLTVPTGAAGEKVAIIVGPTGSITNTYRNMANQVATAAAAQGATVVKVYSPNATWAKVKAAVNGADIVVYFGHGNGWPSPYSSVENTDRVNGFGLNRTTTNGDADNWQSTLVYCGEKAMLGTLTDSDGAAQRQYCVGKLTPAPGFVMVYAQAHYAPGFGERYKESDPKPTLSQGQQRVRNYSTPPLKLGASAYFATAYGDADDIVTRVLTRRTTTYGNIWKMGTGYSASALRTMTHPDVAGAQVWVQSTVAGPSFHFGDPDYWYAFAGNPNGTPGGAFGPTPVPTPTPPPAVYDPPVRLVFQPGTYVGYKFGAGGAVTATKSYTLYSTSGAATSQLAAIGGQPGMWFSIVNGVWAGYWIRDVAGVDFAPAPTTTPVPTATPLPTPTPTPSPTPSGGELPDPASFSPAQKLSFQAGTHTGYQFSSSGKPTATKSYTLSRNSGASTSMRRTLPGQSGYWFYVTNGVWAGHWLRESGGLYLTTSGGVGSLGAADTTYAPTARLDFQKGTHTGYKFSASGGMTGQKTYTLGAGSGANTSQRKVIANQYGRFFYVTNGVWAGYWVRESDVIYLH